jgi:predicted NACHT family NTPase
MNDLFNVFQAILTALKQPLTPWLVIVFIVLFVLRDRIKKLIDTFLDWLGTQFETDVGYRRFEPTYRDIIRQNHLYLKIVGIRTEEERRPKITDAYVPITLVLKGSSLDQAVLIEQVTRDTPYTLILGDPGAGKSTLLDYLTIEYTRPTTSTKSRFSPISLLKPLRRRSPTSCPIYISLRRCAPANRTLLDDILDPNTEILPQAVHEQMSKNFIRRSVERGRAMLLLDGLDEVASEDVYRTVIKKINDFIQLYQHNKVVVTCRKVGWKGGLDAFQVFTALPLDAQQQHDFVHKWYAAILQYTQFGQSIEGSEKNKAEQEANKLLDLLRFKERLRELASNPLMLALICLVHRQRQNLPRGRAELYKDCLEILLGRWDRTDKDLYQKSPTTEEKMQMLRRIAFDMHNRGVKEESRQKLEALAQQFLPDVVGVSIPPAEFVRQIEERSGLLVERSIDRLAFAHLTLQEFLVVEYCRVEQKENMTLAGISDWSAWREPVLLMCGVITDPNPFLAQLFAIQPIIAIEGLVEAEPTRLICILRNV